MTIEEPYRLSRIRRIDAMIGAVILIGLAAILIPEYLRQQQHLEYLKEVRRPAEIYKWMYRYSLDHEGEFPPDLQTLADSQPLDIAIFRNPKNDAPVGPAERVNEWTDFAYVSGLDDNVPSDMVVLFVNPELYEEGFGYLVFGDSHVSGTQIIPELEKLAGMLREHPEWKLIVPPSMPVPEPLKEFVDRE